MIKIYYHKSYMSVDSHTSDDMKCFLKEALDGSLGYSELSSFTTLVSWYTVSTVTCCCQPNTYNQEGSIYPVDAKLERMVHIWGGKSGMILDYIIFFRTVCNLKFIELGTEILDCNPSWDRRILSFMPDWATQWHPVQDQEDCFKIAFSGLNKDAESWNS